MRPAPGRLPYARRLHVATVPLRGVGVTVKTCTGRCGRELPLVTFPRDATKRDGRGARCRECVSADRRERRRDVTRERVAAALAAPGRRRLARVADELTPPADPQAPARAARIVELADEALRRRLAGS